jgi:drug/metabolite transporter (DMT)-like permease
MTQIALSPGLGFVGLGLAASAFWGASDFLGGLATRKANVVLVVALAHGLSLVLLLLGASLTHTPFPAGHFVLRGLGAGAFGGGALIAYYQALALGEMGITTALSGLLTALVPVVYAFFMQGAPKSTQLMGFVLAAAAIALIAYAPSGKPRPLALTLAVLAGLSFGAFLIVLKLDSARGLVWQLIFSRVASTTLAWVIVFRIAMRSKLGGTAWSLRFEMKNVLWLAGSAGALEAIGSLFYMYCSTEGRLDVAAVLKSLYPVVTIVLAAWILKEKTTASQALGMALALGAVVLVSL